MGWRFNTIVFIYRERNKKHPMYDKSTWKIDNGVLTGFLGEDIIACIPDEVQVIGPKAFQWAAKTRKVLFPEHPVAIGEKAFMGSSIEEIALPEGITRIEKETFSGCSKLRKVIMPEGLNYIGIRAFAGTGDLKQISLPDGVSLIDEEAFLESGLLKLTAPGTTYIMNASFARCRKLKTVSLPDIELLGDAAFSECTELEKVRLGKGILSVSSFAFYHCSRLKEIYLPDSLTEIGIGAFWGDKNIKVSVNPKLKPHIEHYYRDNIDTTPYGIEWSEYMKMPKNETIFDKSAGFIWREEVQPGDAESRNTGDDECLYK